jgi:hypothetical protein
MSGEGPGAGSRRFPALGSSAGSPPAESVSLRRGSLSCALTIGVVLGTVRTWLAKVRPAGSLRDGLQFVNRCEPLERVAFDLPNPLAREPEAKPDVVERLGFGAAESVAEGEHLAVAIG